VPVKYRLYSITPTGRTASRETQCLYSTTKALLRLLSVQHLEGLSPPTHKMYIYSQYEPDRICKVSVPVKYTYTYASLWDVQPVHSLSASTVQMFLY